MQNPWIQNLQIERADCVKCRWTAGRPGVWTAEGLWTTWLRAVGSSFLQQVLGCVAGRALSVRVPGSALQWEEAGITGTWKGPGRLWKNPVPLLFTPVCGRGIAEVMGGGGTEVEGGRN